jgi:hypothetical protein
MFVTTRVTLELKSPAMGIVLRILYMPMLTATAERPGVRGWALKATSIQHLWDPSVNGESFCTFFKVLRCITQTLLIKQSPGQDVPTSFGEPSGSSGA